MATASCQRVQPQAAAANTNTNVARDKLAKRQNLATSAPLGVKSLACLLLATAAICLTPPPSTFDTNKLNAPATLASLLATRDLDASLAATIERRGASTNVMFADAKVLGKMAKVWYIKKKLKKVAKKLKKKTIALPVITAIPIYEHSY